MSDDDELRLIVLASLKILLTSGSICPPVSSFHLLTRVIACELPQDLFSANNPRPRLKLTDLSRFESILEDLSRTWDGGTIVLLREGGSMSVIDLQLHVHGRSEPVNPKKRKRIIDEDADSAAGGETTEDQEFVASKATEVPLGAFPEQLKEVYALLQKGTARGRLLAERHQSIFDNFEPICPHITKDECWKARQFQASLCSPSPSAPAASSTICDLVHFRPLIRPHTDPSLGHCSYLNTCYSEPTYANSPSIPPFPGSGHGQVLPGLNVNMRGPVSLPSGLGAGGRGKEKAPCRYLHYEIDWDGGDGEYDTKKSRGKEIAKRKPHKLGIGMGPNGTNMQVFPPQWINCDVRRFDYSVLGKFHVIMADPPWDIHMSLPYGTMTDDEMRAMPIPTLQDEGFLFLWVTGRAMEVGRECLRVWGYTRVDEVVWVKTNQLQRVIRTGRTGHWLNHTKEHMLVGVKTVTDESGALKFPAWANRGLDTDVIVSEVRETSRKPDEVYGMIDRMCPGGRKIEIFGRKHNTRPGWLTLGNQLGHDQIYEEELAARIKARYPERTIMSPAINI